jgi:DNA helicase-2/ATP-dependent DNA helicase PcrA
LRWYGGTLLRFIFDTIRSLEKEKADMSKICILTRDNSYNISLSRYLNSLQYEGVDFEFILVDQFKFFRRQEIKASEFVFRLLPM